MTDNINRQPIPSLQKDDLISKQHFLCLWNAICVIFLISLNILEPIFDSDDQDDQECEDEVDDEDPPPCKC